MNETFGVLHVPKSADVVIIGAGIMGCATAYYLAQNGISVVVLDKGRVAGQQSSRAWGFVRVQARDPAEIELMVESLRLWRELERDLGQDLEWRQGGCLFLAANQEELAEQEEWLQLVRPHRLDSRLVTSAEVARLIPALAKPAIGGLYTHSDGQAEPTKVAPAFATAARKFGAIIIEGCGATEIDIAGGKVIGVQTERGVIRANTIVVAAGASSRAVLDAVGLSLPQQYVRGTVLRTNCVKPVTSAAFTGFGVGFRQRSDGSFNVADELYVDVDLTIGHLRALKLFLPGLIRHRRSFSLHVNGALFRDLQVRLQGRLPNAPLGGPRDPQHQPEPRRIFRAIENMQSLFPSVGDLAAVDSWGGLIDCTPDGIPVIDVPGSPQGMLVATGFTAHGFALGPIVGKLLSEWIVAGQPSINLDEFRFRRFQEGNLKLPYAL